MTAIEFNHVSKQYRLGLVSTGTLCHDLNRFWQTKPFEFDWFIVGFHGRIAA